MPRTGNEFPFDAEAAIVAALAAKLDGATPVFASVLDHEPDEIAGNVELPCAALMFTRAPDDRRYTGGATETTWGWRLNLYVSLDEGWAEAQRRLKTIVPKAIAVFRDDPSLGDRVERATISDPGGEPEYSPEEGLAWKTLTIAALTEEV